MALYSFLYSFTFVPSLYEFYMLHVCLLQHQHQQCLYLASFQICCKAMATVVNFSSIAPSQRMCLKPMAGPAIDSLTIKRTCRFVQQNRTDTKQHISYTKRRGEDKLSANVRGLFPIMATTISSTFSPGSQSPSDTIHEFYDCINHKNLKQLGHYISRDCYIEECSFSTPLRGKKVMIIIINNNSRRFPCY